VQRVVRQCENIELVLISQFWPLEDRGYGIAVKASLNQYLKVFARVHFLGLVNEAFAEPQRWKASRVDWFHLPIPARPKWLRFVISLPRRLPAIAVRHAAGAAAVQEAVGQIHAHARAGGRRLAVVFEDVPIACLLPALRRRFPHLAMAVRSHNVMVKAFNGFQREGPLPVRLCWRIELAKIRRFEQRVWKAADRFWALSDNDSQEYQKRLSVLPDGVLGVSLESTRYAGIQPGDPLNVIHVGSTDQRKVAGLTEFIRRAWPAVRCQVPQARLLLAGRGSEQFADVAQGIETLGFVADDKTILEKGLIFVNPQQIGSGVKLKSIVAMLAGKALVSTPTGIEGVQGTHGKDFFVARDMDAMAAQIVALLKNTELALEVARSARALAASSYNEENLSHTAIPLLESFADTAAAERPS
jgi:glycosyltransferase involved in cell wall biosynthesis